MFSSWKELDVSFRRPFNGSRTAAAASMLAVSPHHAALTSSKPVVMFFCEEQDCFGVACSWLQLMTGLLEPDTRRSFRRFHSECARRGTEPIKQLFGNLPVPHVAWRGLSQSAWDRSLEDKKLHEKIYQRMKRRKKGHSGSSVSTKAKDRDGIVYLLVDKGRFLELMLRSNLLRDTFEKAHPYFILQWSAGAAMPDLDDWVPGVGASRAALSRDVEYAVKLWSWYMPSWFPHMSHVATGGGDASQYQCSIDVTNAMMHCFLCAIFYIGEGLGRGERFFSELASAARISHGEHLDPRAERIRHILKAASSISSPSIGRMYASVVQVTCPPVPYATEMHKMYAMEFLLLRTLQRFGKHLWDSSDVEASTSKAGRKRKVAGASASSGAAASTSTGADASHTCSPLSASCLCNKIESRAVIMADVVLPDKLLNSCLYFLFQNFMVGQHCFTFSA
jgi:hypothetical protein